MEDKNYLTEAFKAFDGIDTLNEEVFNISFIDGLERAKEFEDEVVEEEPEEIIDLEAEDEEEVKDEYLGKAILQCSICGSLIYKDPSEVVVNEELEVANVGEPCPVCQSEDGYIVVGEVKEFCDDEECEEHHEEEHEEEDSEEIKDEESVEDEEKVEIKTDDIDEAIKTRKRVRTEELKESSERDKIDADADDKKETAKADYEKTNDDADADRDEKLKKHDLKESDKPAATSVEDAQKWVDYDMKKYGRISARTNRLVKKAGFQIVKDDHGDYEVIAGKFESIKEDFEKVEIETDREKMSMTAEENGKVVVTTEPKEEIIAPISTEIEDEFKVETPEDEEEIDVSFDEFEESDFDELGESYLRKVYENVKSFKTTSGSINGNQLKLEGLITFKSGKVGKTNFVFESYKATKTGKLKFIGENKQFAQGKKSFILTGRANNNKLVCESLTYNYSAKAPSGNTKRLYGTVRK